MRARRSAPVPGDSRAAAGWQAIYVDSPETLAPKLALANERGLAGAGFWAIGYERGLARLPRADDLVHQGRYPVVTAIASAWPATAHSPTTATGGTRAVSRSAQRHGRDGDIGRRR